MVIAHKRGGGILDHRTGHERGDDTCNSVDCTEDGNDRGALRSGSKLTEHGRANNIDRSGETTPDHKESDLPGWTLRIRYHEHNQAAQHKRCRAKHTARHARRKT